MQRLIAFALTAALSLATRPVATQISAPAKAALSAESTDAFPVSIKVDAGRDRNDCPSSSGSPIPKVARPARVRASPIAAAPCTRATPRPAFARKHELAAKHGVKLEGALTWAFEFEDQPYFAGFRALASNGIALPVLNVLRMFSRMAGRRVLVESSAAVPLEDIVANGVGGSADVSALASRGPARLALMAWHYHDDDRPGPAADVRVKIHDLPASMREATLTHDRIDEQHSNAYATWQRMGSPVAPNREQYLELKSASALTPLEPPARVSIVGGTATLRLTLPRQAVSLLTLDWSDRP